METYSSYYGSRSDRQILPEGYEYGRFPGPPGRSQRRWPARWRYQGRAAGGAATGLLAAPRPGLLAALGPGCWRGRDGLGALPRSTRIGRVRVANRAGGRVARFGYRPSPGSGPIARPCRAVGGRVRAASI